MADEDSGPDDGVWPEAFRRFLRGLDPSHFLPGRTDGPRLGSGPLRPEREEAPQEPAADVLEGVREVFVTVEVPGVSREDIELRVSEGALVVAASTPDRKYYQEIPLPAPVLPTPVRTTYRNGVLDVTLEKTRSSRAAAA